MRKGRGENGRSQDCRRPADRDATPLRTTELFALVARLMRLDSIMAIDHFQNVIPTGVWDQEFSWIAAQRPTPHEHFDYQVFLGRLASRAGRMHLGVGVTDPIRRHPVVIARPC